MRRKYIALFELYEYINQFLLSVPQFPQFLEARKRHEMKKKKEIKIRRGKDNTFVSYSGSILLNRYTYI